MKTYSSLLLFFLFPFLFHAQAEKPKSDFILSFGSCNNQNSTNKMWDEILKNNPDIFIWGGDIIYSDTYNMEVMEKNYIKQKNNPTYQNFTQQVPVIGTWDDHDYGVNDGGLEYSKKEEVQQLFLNFFDVAASDSRRLQEGIYFSKKTHINKHSINIIILDTRYFRTALTKDKTGTKRYIPNQHDNGTMLGEKQWIWLENELKNSTANFNIIVSSIQFLSSEHGFESWGNMPNEVRKMNRLIAGSKAKGVLILSGDRHISEISKDTISNVSYPLIDFTSSGLTHSYRSFKGESNKFRVSKVVSSTSFGMLYFNFQENSVLLEIRGENNELYESLYQKY